MNYTAGRYFCSIPLNYVPKVFERIATMQKQWQTIRPHQIQLLLKIGSLGGSVTEFQTIVIQTTFTNGHYFRSIIVDVVAQLLVIFLWIRFEFFAPCWMTSHCYEQTILVLKKRIFYCSSMPQ